MPKKSGLVSPREATIGRRVQSVREHINWPQPAFAAELDISRDRLASIEYARTPLRYSTGYRLCVVFEINPGWLADGAGEMKPTLILPDLPAPEEFPVRSLFSRIYDLATAVNRGSPGKKPTPRGEPKPTRDQVLIPNFDATAHIIRSLTDLLAREKFHSQLERQDFAQAITSYARELALHLRREKARERAVSIPTRRGGLSSRPADLAGTADRNRKIVVQLRAGIRRLEQEIVKLEAAMRALHPLAINPLRLPRAAGMELAQLENALEKIARQLHEAERTIKALVSQGAGKPS